VWVTPDSKSIIYVRLSADQSSGAIYGVNADGTNPQVLVPSFYYLPEPTCVPNVAFSADGYAVVSYCNAPAPDAGSTYTLATFAYSNGWAPGAVVPNASPSFAIDPDGGRFVTTTAASSGALEAFPIDGGGTGTVLDPSTPIGAGQFFTGGPATPPWSILYSNDAGQVEQVNASGGTPQVMVDGGVQGLTITSPDHRWLILNGGPASLLASAVTPGTPQVVATTSAYDGGLISYYVPYGAFSPDDNYVIFFSNVDINVGTGVVHSVPVGSSAPAKLLSHGLATQVQPIEGAKVLIADGYYAGDGAAGTTTTDIDLADPSSDAATVGLVTGVSTQYAVSADHTVLVYSVTGGPAPGIYTVPISVK
jgi:hypothetical protein